MLKAAFSGFDWDHGNLEKCPEHGLSREAVEAFFISGHFLVAGDEKHSQQEERFLAIGRAHRRAPFILVVFTFREFDGKRRIRPISARYMHKREIKRYEEALAEIEE